MNFIEALELTRHGKKIRNATWDKDKFIYLDDYYGKLIWYNQDRYNLSCELHIIPLPTYGELTTSWEIYKENPKIYNFQEAFEAFYKHKKTISRLSKPWQISKMQHRNLTNLTFKYEDIIANDWIIEDE